MVDDERFSHELFKGLQALADSSFPKRCETCGRVFESAEQFLAETESIHKTKTGLKQSQDDDGTLIVEVFRNCPCGSTLMDLFGDRRDLSERGEDKRDKFEALIAFVASHDVNREVARTELLKVLQGGKSDLISSLLPHSTSANNS
ncbi:oxidoreductase [Solemya pervernicosa gill symbiont]|uniref:Oxidoreductase n=2 Tax=Gammaproteobacteria incertae sedis TaxID=118884 RepID=A0A1T2L641_9GAMM|nr:oxidoreductase [Candidatus Reidiella endopervernicosa]OOZ40406.1 oxidoreductase [Solemya pervernicosa gill symbiont]QKQ25550.1 oxidoreductase [Candidatus Reidiella endopervernicosa]